MSGLAKFTSMKSYLPAPIASVTACGDAGSRHLGLLVVRGDVLGRRDHLAVLALERLLAPAVEEVRHVRVLLGLGAAELREPAREMTSGKMSANVSLREGDRQPEGGVVRRHARVASVEGRQPPGPRESVERGHREGPRELARAVGPEVEVERRVAGPDAVVVT